VIEIDGSAGEGGGQILRTSLALSMATGVAVRVVNVRGRRARPGLLRQHLTAARAIAAVCSGTLRGAEIGSTTLELTPGAVKHGEHQFAIGSAGSAALVLTTVVTGLLRHEGESRIVVEGGTDARAAPSSDFLVQVWAPLVRALGADLHVEVERRGYYPAGGGRLVATLRCPARLNGFERMERGRTVERRAVARVSAIPPRVAHRELAVLKDAFGLKRDALVVHEEAEPRGPGNVVALTWRCEHAVEVFSAFGERERRAVEVAADVVREASVWDALAVPVGVHQADQLVLLLALAGEGAFRTVAPSLHTRTQIELVPRLLGVRIALEESGGRATIRVARR
jgi:RNA 3'-terminal phosphate cyclase (ATP)